MVFVITIVFNSILVHTVRDVISILHVSVCSLANTVIKTCHDPLKKSD